MIKRVIVELKGGLGNQMFQYAAARGLSMGEEIYIDTNFLLSNQRSTDKFTARQYELHVFEKAKISAVSPLEHNVYCSKKLPYKIFRKLLIPRFKYVLQQDYYYINNLADLGNYLYLDGYFQSEKYFSAIRGELLKEFSFQQLDVRNLVDLQHIQAHPNSVSIHVRRGDYLKPEVIKHHGLLSMNYYKTAIEILENKLRNAYYFIFSDDPEWCRQNFYFLHGRYKLLGGNNSKEAWKDMCLMTYCKHHIVANSSFSWWGAWLSKEQGVNLAPYRWFNPDTVQFNIDDFIPSSWQVVYYD